MKAHGLCWIVVIDSEVFVLNPNGDTEFFEDLALESMG